MSKKPRTKGRLSGNMNLANLGLLDINDLNFDDDGGNDDDGDDGDLEAELNALISGGAPRKREEPKQKRAPTDLATITAMADAAMKDQVSDHESDYEGIENDEELLAELNELGESSPPETPSRKAVSRPPTVPMDGASRSAADPSPQDIVDVLQIRLKNYQDAESAARDLNDISKARRFSRGIKTLQDQLKAAKLGKPVLGADIPPPVAIPKPKHVPIEQPAPVLEEERPQPARMTEPSPMDETPPLIPPRSASNRYPPPEIADLLGEADDDFDPTEFEEEEVETKPPPRPAPRPPAAAPLPSRPAPQIPSASQSRPVVQPTEPSDQKGLLMFRRDQYKKAALEAKHRGDTEQALKYVRIAKQFDSVIQALSEGKPVDLTGMPPPPGVPGGPEPSKQPTRAENPEDYDLDVKEDPSIYKAPPAAQTILEALEQRLAKYEETEAQAKAENNSSKVRRIGRILKDYKSAIKAQKAGKPYDFADLPAPPGFGPIPLDAPKPPSQGPAPQRSAPSVVAKPQSAPGRPAAPRPMPTPAPTTSKQSIKKQLSVTFEKQKQFLLERQTMFRDAAKEALKNGASKEQAMVYLRMSKGIQPMIEATENGLPVDLSTIPIPPQLQQDFVVLEAEESGEQLSADSEELYRTLERELVAQFETCSRNQENFFKLGDVSSGTKFEKLGLDTKRDLSVLKASWKRGDSIPVFRYEDRVFTIIRHNHDVPENQMQVSVIRGITLPGKPNELDTYVKIDFPFRAEAPQSYRGYTVKDTTNPEYNTTCSFEVVRHSRSFIRVLKRIQLKIEVWSKRGFLRADGLIGVASIKLADLETKCEIHDVFPLMDGRKDSGGKLEVKIRVSEPFSTKQIEEIKERWLIIGA
ncbi:coiled-coil and C2 domain-containing protein 1-like [Galendromus occidentalis]|uniref:Coiled-coil and C2 domain-containing protein 1-like n=1 Tax=Galendromus occidentalis TaxID=34638 RepID=A0AAJ6QN14_9ACAR|nr:coiled-coil and C2 domain-containing protein 1-like [Galendromus occidentalis]